MGVGIKMTATLNSQNVAANASSVTVKVIAEWNNGTYNTTGVPDGSMTINGTTYNFSGIRYNAGRTSSGSETIMTKTVTISHNTDGTKSFSYSAVFNSDSSSGTQRASGSMTLPAIARLSGLTVDFSKALGETIPISADRKAAAYTHTLTYECGSYNGTICTKSSAVSWNFTPPIDWANSEPNGASVWASFKLETFNGNTSVGSVTKSGFIAIPATVVPSCSVSVEDLTGNYALLGKYLQSKSKLKITVSAAGAYGSTIKGYTVTADGNTYTTSTSSTDVLQGSGQLPVTVKVTDSRGRTATATTTISVEPYTAPRITLLTVHRCNADGTENQSGSYCKATYSFEIAGLDSKNTHTASIRYKKSADASYSSVELQTGYAADEAFTIFPADDGFSYDVQLHIADRYLSAERGAKLSTGYTLMHFASSGKGVAFGKVSEQDGMEIDMKIDVHGNRITNLATPSESTDATTKSYVDTIISGLFPVGSAVMTLSDTNPGVRFGGTWECKAKYISTAEKQTIKCTHSTYYGSSDASQAPYTGQWWSVNRNVLTVNFGYVRSSSSTQMTDEAAIGSIPIDMGEHFRAWVGGASTGGTGAGAIRVVCRAAGSDLICGNKTVYQGTGWTYAWTAGTITVDLSHFNWRITDSNVKTTTEYIWERTA